MSERGVFAIDRGIFEHELFATDEPLSRLEAWVWLLKEAAWKARVRVIDGKKIELRRGQVAHSIRFLAGAWRWRKSTVSRFLETLKKQDMIGTQTGTGITIITICNYNKYQRVALPKRDTSGTQPGTEAGHERDKLENIKNIESSNGPPPDAANIVSFPAENLKKQFFDRCVEMFGPQGRGLAGSILKAKGDDVRLARSAIETAATKIDPKSYIGAIIRGRNAPDDARARGDAW